MTSRRWVAAVLLATGLGVTGCGTPALTGTAGKDITALPASTLPASLNGLAVTPEKVDKALLTAKHSYLDSVGFFSLRKDKVVQATVQVGHFGPSARLSSPDFRTSIVNSSSPGTPATVNIGSTPVQQSRGTKSTVTVWFSKDRLVILTVLKTYPGGRSLLEQALTALPSA